MKKLLSVIILIITCTFFFTGCSQKCPHQSLDANHICSECGKETGHIYRDNKCVAEGCTATSPYEYESVPKAYLSSCSQKGTVEKLTYTTRAYSAELYRKEQDGKAESLTSKKELYVYLPYGYDASKQYNVLYLLHGSGGNAQYWIKKTKLTNVVDNMIQKGDCDPFIIVTPTFYYSDVIKDKKLQDSRYDQNYFYYELREVIIPLVESRYSTFADRDTEGKVSEKNIIQSREHRAMAGCSRGSRTTVASGLMKSLDYISYFGCFEGMTDSGKTVMEAISNSAFESYHINFMYHGQGDYDFTLDEHISNYRELVQYGAERLVEGKNLVMVQKYNLEHEENSWVLDMYNFIKLHAFKITTNR